MSNTDVQKLPDRTARQFKVGRVFPLLAFVGATMIGADFTAISLAPLKTLQIPYDRVMDYEYFIIPAACALLWLATIRWKPDFGAIVAILLCFFFISRIPAYAEHRVSHLPVRRWLEPSELKTMESRGGFKVSERGAGGATFVLVARQNEQQARKELAALGLLAPASPTTE